MSRSAAEEQGRGLTDVLFAFPGNSRQLLRLANDVMCKTGELSRGEREAIAAHVSKLNAVEYCVFYHSMFAEVFSSDSRDHTRDMSPLLSYAVALCNGKERDLALARSCEVDLALCRSTWQDW